MLDQVVAICLVVQSIYLGALAFFVGKFFALMMQPAGGLAYGAFTFIVFRVRWTRTLYTAFVDFVAEPSFLFKSLAVIVSSSGPIVPLLLLQWLAPSLLTATPVLWGTLFASVATTLKIMHGVHLMDAPNFRAFAPGISRYVGFDVDQLDNYSKMRLARSHYTDMALINLLMIVVCYGSAVFCTSNLGLLGPGLVGRFTPITAMLETLTFLRFLFARAEAVPIGPWMLAINGFFGLCLVLYTVFFVSLSSKLVDEDPGKGFAEEAAAKTEASTGSNSSENPWAAPVREAVVRPRSAAGDAYGNDWHDPRVF